MQEEPLLTPKARGPVISASAELNPRATCQQAGCTWPAVDAPHAEASAYDHAQDTGHSVAVDHIRRQVVMAP